VAVLRHVAGISELCLLTLALLGEFGLGVRGRAMRLVASLLAVKMARSPLRQAMAVHPNRPSPQSSSSMPKPGPACRRRKSGRPKARLALAYEREARPGICAPPRLRAVGRGSS